MSLYTDAVQTRIIDPIFNQTNVRSEIRLQPGNVYMSNMRLINLGARDNSGSLYNGLCGASAVIKSISIMDGNEVLDSLNEARVWNAFKGFNHSNDENRDVSVFTHRAQQGYTWSGLDSSGGVGGLGSGASVLAYESGTSAQLVLSGSDATSPQGWMSLRYLFPFLENSLYVPTNVYPRFRVVIEYNSSTIDFLNSAGNNVNTLQPALVVDQIVDPARESQIMREYRGVSFKAIEHDRVILDAIEPSVSETDPQVSTTFNINGFNDKTINRLLIVNTPTSNDPIYQGGSQTQTTLNIWGSAGSCSQLGEQVQVRVNGANKLPGNGITRPNERLGMLSDTWGNCNVVPFGNDTFPKSSDNELNLWEDDGWLGNTDYVGIVINEHVRDLQLTFVRNGLYDPATTYGQGSTRYNQELQLNLYAEVNKAVVREQDGYRILYS